ncbi:meiotic nuclear division protein 1 homolog [Oppia nitens]|uniref:meiotic nuclear division protein 1 homolog n=1 Tax=Oppia nitens TaxID=1686743 RepID=UPI0023DA2592|nr:meiotic nuclear division protein 1 homolog [Oppia nitens]
MSKSKKKGLTIDEKRHRLLELFHQKKDVFLLKDLEKLGPKEKGIVMQSVKDILQSLVADDLVESDKIGSSTYFWSFPAKAVKTKKQKIKDLKQKISEIKQKSKELDIELKKYQLSDKEAQRREKALNELHSLENKRNELKAKLEVLKDCDPQFIKQLNKDCEVSKEAINRWTDNVFLVKSWCKQKFGIEDSELNKQFSIPEDFDYPE